MGLTLLPLAVAVGEEPAQTTDGPRFREIVVIVAGTPSLNSPCR